MKEFRIVIKRRIVAFTALGIFSVIAGIYDVFSSNIGETENGSFFEGYVEGFIIGLIISLGLVAVIQIIKLKKIFGNDEQLQLLYNKENDERMKFIKTKSGMPLVLIVSVIMIMAALVGSFFNYIVFFTLIITAFIQLSISVVIKIYYLKRMWGKYIWLINEYTIYVL